MSRLLNLNACFLNFVFHTYPRRMKKQPPFAFISHVHNRLALLEVTLPCLSVWVCLTGNLSPLTDTVCGLMSALCANASVSHLLPHYSSNLIHKGAQVTLWGVTHGVCVSITSYLMYLSPLLFLWHIYLDEQFLLCFIFHLIENMLLKHVLEPCSQRDVFIIQRLFLCMWSKPSLRSFHFPCCFPFSLPYHLSILLACF